ncbi:MAG: glycosyltransferase family 2 protein [Bacteroidales bacterium]|nr:glycosyltransferase family 2 protein [Bacteroidales bacterium]
MIPLSVVIIAYNEERNIERCLESVKDIADDIVVLDSFSTDRTEEICRNKGVRFFQHNFDGHIEQKNRVITFAKFPHMLSLDADEALSEELKNSILDVKKSFNCDGYTFNRLTNYCGKWIYHCGWYPDKKLRLWDSRKGSWGGINPHDKYEMDKNCKIQHLKGDLLHYSYYSVEQHKLLAEKYSTISAEDMFKKGKKASLFKLIFSPPFKFFQCYFLKFGFIDGRYGFIISKLSAYITYRKYYKLKKLYSENA